jgi:quinol monooxygenase YgiN
MKTKVLIFFCTAVMAVACCNRGNKCCKESADEKACPHAEAKCSDLKKVISARVFIKSDNVADFLAETQSLLVGSRAEEGNVSYSLFQDPQDATKFFFFEEWKNQAAVDIHFETAHFKQFGETLNKYGSAPAIITIYDSVSEKQQ